MNEHRAEQSSYVPPVIDEGREDFEIGWVDIVLSILTLPLLFWAFMYAVSGNEKLYATRAGRMRVYTILLVLEAIIAVGVVWWLR